MEIVEAILTFFKKNNKAVIIVIFVLLTIAGLLKIGNKELILMLIPIAISFVVTMFFRSCDKKDNQLIRERDKKEAQSIRDRDKEDNDARNLRAELREYFLTNCKPIIDEIVKEAYHKRTKYIDLIDKNDEPLNKKDGALSIIELQKYFIYQLNLVSEMQTKVIPLLTFIEKTSHKEYEQRFNNYYYISQHILMLYDELIKPQILDSKALYESTTLNQKEKEKALRVIVVLIDNIDFILAESELTLFNHRFDNDKIIFQKHIKILDDCVLKTGLDNTKDFLFDREKFEQKLQEYNNKTTKTK